MHFSINAHAVQGFSLKQVRACLRLEPLSLKLNGSRRGLAYGLPCGLLYVLLYVLLYGFLCGLLCGLLCSHLSTERGPPHDRILMLKTWRVLVQL